jgi:hypothetical protein
MLAIIHVSRGGEPVSAHQVESMVGVARLCALVCVVSVSARVRARVRLGLGAGYMLGRDRVASAMDAAGSAEVAQVLRMSSCSRWKKTGTSGACASWARSCACAW